MLAMLRSRWPQAATGLLIPALALAVRAAAGAAAVAPGGVGAVAGHGVGGAPLPSPARRGPPGSTGPSLGLGIELVSETQLPGSFPLVQGGTAASLRSMEPTGPAYAASRAISRATSRRSPA